MDREGSKMTFELVLVSFAPGSSKDRIINRRQGTNGVVK